MYNTKYLYSILLCLCLIWSCQESNTDSHNANFQKDFTEADYSKGKNIIAQMQAAYGGKTTWQAYTVGRFHQKADWYGELALSGWDTLPQHFAMISKLGTNDSELFLINGKNKRQNWGIEKNKTYLLQSNQEKVFADIPIASQKVLLKNFWFQFPFRVDEANHIAFAGEQQLNGQDYDLVSVSWAKNQNPIIDHCILYLNRKSHFIDLVHYELNATEMLAEFANFKAVDKLILPYSQYTKTGSPLGENVKSHENHYVDILMGVD